MYHVGEQVTRTTSEIDRMGSDSTSVPVLEKSPPGDPAQRARCIEIKQAHMAGSLTVVNGEDRQYPSVTDRV